MLRQVQRLELTADGGCPGGVCAHFNITNIMRLNRLCLTRLYAIRQYIPNVFRFSCEWKRAGKQYSINHYVQ